MAVGLIYWPWPPHISDVSTIIHNVLHVCA